MNGRMWILVPAAALLFQTVPVAFMRIVAWMAYGPLPCIPPSLTWPVSIAGLAVCAGVSLFLGSLGAYLALTRSGPKTAAGMITVCCLPSLAGGAVYLYAVLIFLTIA